MNHQRAREFVAQYPDLGLRNDGFVCIFEKLMDMNKSEYLIVETGTIRQENNFRGDGQSTILFNDFVKQYGGMVISIDNDPQAVELAKTKVDSEYTKVIEGDSVTFLNSFPLKNKIDLLYLDSYDSSFKPTNDQSEEQLNKYRQENHLSALHALKELCTTWAELRSECLIVIDDNITQELLKRYNSNATTKYEYDPQDGKGLYLRNFMLNLEIKPFLDEYQLGYIKPLNN